MNLFFLSLDPRAAAQMQCDKHVVKMILEVAPLCEDLQGNPRKTPDGDRESEKHRRDVTAAMGFF